ncbi:MAG: ATP-binding cassette domain-containing protein [Lawsonibacter sp.]|nr:ATP-binding cassette domain-containing protein [Lawsonibacter sp.]
MSSSSLSVQGLTRRFEAGTVNEKLALDHLDLEVPAGQFVTVLGSNGSGKSTLFNAILGRLEPDSGHIFLGREDITRQKDYKRALNIGCLYQNPMRGTAPTMTIEENLALAYTRKAAKSFFAVNRKDNAYFRDLLATLNMGLEDRMKTKMGLLSGGQRQAASLLMATVAQPKLLLLDEHTAALDPGAAEKVMEVTEQIISRDKITTLMITHDMDYALTVGSRTIMLDSGRIVLDLSGQERDDMTSGGLAELFYTKSRRKKERGGTL